MTSRYTAEGITAKIAEALKVTCSLTRADLRYTNVGAEGEAVLRKAVEGRSWSELNL